MRIFHAVLLAPILFAAMAAEAKAALFTCDYEVRRGAFNTAVVIARGTVDQQAPDAEAAQLAVADMLYARYGQDENPFHIVCRPQ